MWWENVLSLFDSSPPAGKIGFSIHPGPSEMDHYLSFHHGKKLLLLPSLTTPPPLAGFVCCCHTFSLPLNTSLFILTLSKWTAVDQSIALDSAPSASWTSGVHRNAVGRDAGERRPPVQTAVSFNRHRLPGLRLIFPLPVTLPAFVRPYFSPASASFLRYV